MQTVLSAGLAAGVVLLAATSRGADWPEWGRTADRNMVSPETHLPDLRAPAGEDTTFFTSDENPCVKWKVRLGTTTWGNPTVAGGRVLVGTSGPGRQGGAIKCLDAETGDLLWQLICPARDFPTPERPEKYDEWSPWDYLVATHAQTLGWGVCSSTSLDGDRAYALTQRGEVVCLDVHGLANGNQGPFLDEARYKAGDGQQPATLEASDADILWAYDLWTEVKTRPADTFSNAALIDGQMLYISSCNGIERWPGWYGKPAAPPNPDAPNLIALDKRTGRLLATDAERIGHAMLHGQWSPPSMGEVNGKRLVFYGGGDGLCYAFEALRDVPQAPVKLRKVWSYDCNLPEYKVIGVDNYSLGDIDVIRWAKGDTEPIKRDLAKHRDANGRLLSMSEIVGSPAFHNNRVYVAIGRDPRHGPGRGALHCIDATGSGDITQSGRIWCFDQIDRSLSTPSIADGLVYIADLTGRLYCLDADTGHCFWTFETGNETWGSTLVADGKVYLVTKKSFHVLAAGKEKKQLSSIRIGADCTPIVADGVVYVLLRCTLYALHQGAQEPAAAPPAATSGAAAQPRPAAGAGGEWPCWRGPHGNGFSAEVPRRLPPEKLLWSRQTAGECHAPISVGEGSVVAADHDRERDYWRCFGAADGQPRWVHEYPNDREMDYGAGPRAAPLIHNGKVFCLNAWGELYCLRIADGSLAWRKHLAAEFAQKTPAWGYTASPLIAHGKLLVSPGGKGGPVAALDPETGAVLWTGAGHGLNYANLTLATLGGVEQVVGYDERTAGAWDLASGRRLWEAPVENASGYIVPSPVAVHGKLLLTSDQEGARLLSFHQEGAILEQPAAINEDIAPDVSTPTVWGETVLAASSGLVLADAAAANPKGLLKTLWIYDDEECVKGVCHAIVSQDRALVMCEDGQLLLLAANRQSCQILDRRKLCDETLTYPALAGGRLYVRDSKSLYCYDLRVDS
ncbi:MAG: PQQ-binding-like beta-propeller repeat protein [Pirellulales bacterium]|nr:PQQ-binding-like beta-propeller repeat protein [Pirellulales bacterium]